MNIKVRVNFLFKTLIILITISFVGCKGQFVEPTNTPAPVREEKAETTPTDTPPIPSKTSDKTPPPMEIPLDLSQIGDLELRCGEGVAIEGEELRYRLLLSSPWENPKVFFDRVMVFGKLNTAALDARNQVYAHPQEGTPVIGTWRIEDNQNCFLGWPLNDKFLGIVDPIEQLLDGKDRTARIEIIGQITDADGNIVFELAFNTFHDIPQTSGSGSGESSDGGGYNGPYCWDGSIPIHGSCPPGE